MEQRVKHHLSIPQNRIMYLLAFDPAAMGGWTEAEINSRLYDLIEECDDPEAHF